jgi:hypothetical protein
MERAELLERLRLVTRRVIEGAERIREQTRVIAELERTGRDTTLAKKRLDEYRSTQADNVRTLEQLQELLADDQD